MLFPIATSFVFLLKEFCGLKDFLPNINALKMKKPALLFINILLTVCCFAQTSASQSIKGKLIDEDNNPLRGATITIKGSASSATSDEEGMFLLSGLSEGGQTIVISYVGLTTIEIKAELKPGQTLNIGTISLNNNTKLLQTVEITGRKEKTYKNSVSFIGSKTATDLKDLPQSVSYVTKELMLDQAAIRVGDVVKNFSGVNQFSFYDDITIRGFRVQGGEGGVQLLNGLRTTTGFWKQPLTNFLERVEVIKGPSGALFGNASPGGTINRVTKKPLAEKRQSLSFTTGSFNTLRALADFTGPFYNNQKVLYRLNIGYENAQTFRDLQFNKNYVIAPSVSFIPNEKTKVNFDLVYNYSDSRLDRGQPVFGDSSIYSVPVSKSLNLINDYLKETNYTITTSLTHQLTNKLSFNASFVRTGYEEDLLEHRSANTYAKDSANRIIPTLVEMQVFIRKRKRFVDNLSAFFTYEFNLGKAANKLVVGYDYGQELQPFGGSQLQASGYRNNTNTAATTYNAATPTKFLYETVNGIKRPVANVAHFDLTAASPYFIADMSKYFFVRRAFDPTKYYFGGWYLQDQVSFGKLQLLLGVRSETYRELVDYLKPSEKKTKTTAILPRAGLVYSATNNINVYATYTQGFQPQTATVLANPNAGGPFDPLESNLIEFGAKTEWLSKRLVINTSVYKIEQKNTLYNAGSTTQPDSMRQVGEETAKGFEIEATGNILPNWNIMASYSYNHAAITESPVAKEVGRQKPNAPKHQGNIWTKYVISKGQLKGIGVGVGGNFVTERFGSIVPTGGDPKVLPAYSLLNAALYYQFEKFSVQVNINNLTNKTHWVGGYDYLRLFPGAPRNWLATVAYTF
jgi:iron complex outermembrane receptor protein